MKKIVCLFFSLMLGLSLVACAAAPDAELGGSGGGFKGDAEVEGDYAAGDEVLAPGEEEPEEGNNQVIIPASQITACAYNDNEYFDFWKSLLTTNQEGVGLFNEYYKTFAFKNVNRIKLTFPAKTYVEVSLLKDDNVVSKSVSDASGLCYLYPLEAAESYTIKMRYLGVNGDYIESIETINGDTDYSQLAANPIVKERIELMFVIDTTGSMGDEINYIKAEVDDVITRVSQANPDAQVLLSILVYRDYGDEYVTRYSDFNADINVSKAFLEKEHANGGGDFEEAVDVALKLAASKQWSNTATKILVHIADAPAHDANIQEWNDVALEFAAMGVRMITVASSGIDKKTEYFFRNQSLITNGHYVYITNDSGIGNDHIEATVAKKPVVEYLNDALVRLINGYHSGIFAAPTYYGNVNKNQ